MILIYFILEVISISHLMSLLIQVYAWGSNTMGQCGQGHTLSPITRPKKVVGLDVAVHQISAGTTHSVAWTAIPTDRYDDYGILISFYVSKKFHYTVDMY